MIVLAKRPIGLDYHGQNLLRFGENEASVALRNCKKIEKLEDPMGPGSCLSFIL